MTKFQCGECGRICRGAVRYREAWGEERTVCPYCGAAESETVRSCIFCGVAVCGGSNVCIDCARRYCSERCGELIRWMKRQEAGIGYFSWTDFLLSHVYGIVECRCERWLLDALPPLSEEDVTPDGLAVKDALWTYVSGDSACLDQVLEWIKEEIA